MLISVASLRWLRDNFEAGTFAPTDLANTYAFPHALNGRRELICEDVDGDCFRWRLQMFTLADLELLEIALQRRAFRDLPLWSSGLRGTVVANQSFHILEPYRDKGLGRALYAAEAQLYERWGIREIHVTAAEEGRVVWMKSFGFLPVYPSLLGEEFIAWQERNGLEAADPPVNPAAYPEDFLRSLERIMLYKVLP